MSGRQTRLTPREHQVLELVASGLQNKEIAGRLAISLRTVQNALRVIYLRLGLYGAGSRIQAAMRLRDGLLVITVVLLVLGGISTRVLAQGAVNTITLPTGVSVLVGCPALLEADRVDDGHILLSCVGRVAPNPSTDEPTASLAISAVAPAFAKLQREAGTHTSASLPVPVGTTRYSFLGDLQPADLADTTLVARYTIEVSDDLAGANWREMGSIRWHAGSGRQPRFSVSPTADQHPFWARVVIDIPKRLLIGAEVELS